MFLRLLLLIKVQDFGNFELSPTSSYEGKYGMLSDMVSYLNSFLAMGGFFSSTDNVCKQFGPRPGPTGPRSAVSNVSGHRCESYCRSRGRRFDPGPVPYFRGD